ncbi:MAG: hypothetical protein DI565_01625 [Ancylobacter novellus]|uniref:Peptidase S1 domain-containing protein n=1 Tax=Ancylobacter novellus TaxID=921 RepID=A0A2W5KWI6_ANCNO|nr:MAG: hypothetical protein DI565_01625 [Ancylobacter novellus]
MTRLLPFRDTASRLGVVACLCLVTAPALAQGAAEAAAAATVSVQAVEPTGDGRAKVADCSGALIGPDLVLTSGHCLDGAAGPTRVAVFAYRGGRPVPQPLAVAAIARHPAHVIGWREKAGDPETRQREIAADLALLRLAAPVDGARPLPLGAGEGGAIAGTGAVSPGGRSGVMKRAALSAVRASTGAGARVVFATAAVTMCGGDSGGPAVGTGTGGEPVLWGVTAAVLKPKGGCGARIAVTPVDPASDGFRAMRAAVGRP